MNCKLYIGCVSRNTVDATISYANENNVSLGLIPSRRQVDFDGGYIGFTNKTLYDYVKSKTKNVILERDHGGPNQGKVIDDGLTSLVNDCMYYDMIHVDPWKKYSNFEEGLFFTKFIMEKCSGIRSDIKFEIATEQSIRPFSLQEIKKLIEACKDFKIEYVVIQSGTGLKENKNIGDYKKEKLIEYCNLVKGYKLLSKEHNGDYIDTITIKEKMSNGLDAINIAPEFGYMESSCYIEHIKDKSNLLNIFYELCYNSGQWKKWVSDSFDLNDKESLIKICGHYVLEQKEFHTEILDKIDKDEVTKQIQTAIKKRIRDIID